MNKLPRLAVGGLVVVALVALIGALAGCPAKPETPAAGGETITETGSTTVLPIASKWQQAFNKVHPDLKIVISGGGSGTGIKALLNKTCNIAASSRKIEDKEIEQGKAAGVNVKEIPIAFDGIAVVVSPANPLKEISIEKLSDIYSGKIKSWNEAGAQGLGEIQVISRDPSSGTYDSFKEIVIQKPDKTRDYAASCVQQASNEAVLNTLEQTKTAIGYLGLGYVNDTVKVLAVIPFGGGKPAVMPSEASVRDNSYPISRMLYLYTDGEPSGNVKTYIDWGLGPDGQAIVKQVGYITLK